MFEKLTYKQKLMALGGIVIILAIAAYKRSFKLTLNAREESQSLIEKLDYIHSNSSNIEGLDSEIYFLDNLIGKGNMEAEIVQQEILNFVSEESKEVSIVSIDEIHEVNDNKFLIYSNQLTVEGGFFDLLNIVYAYEKNFPFSKVVNVHFFTKKNYKTKRTNLYAKIIFQNYEKSN